LHRLCTTISCRDKGLIGPSAYLSPNTVLVLGEGETVDMFRSEMKQALGPLVMLRKNPNKWPPLHTPIMWRKNIPNRSAMLLHSISGGFRAPTVPIASCVTGKISYNDHNVREHLIRWTDQPQHLWGVVCETLSAGIDTVIHVGPEPNVIPATFTRLADNIANQLGGRFLGSFGSRMVTRVARSWLSNSISTKTALLRAPFVEHIILENWLLEQKVPGA
jgi:[acyl-carrier-protein] S-malonyltransferase